MGRNAKEKASYAESVPVGASVVVTSGFRGGLEFPIDREWIVIEVTVPE
jgi:preprotein translocase subunit YajC